MALQATEQQGSRPPASDADTDPARRPVAFGGMGGSKRAAVAGMPDDALVEILSRLPAKFLCRSKCVSKAWCDLIVDRLRCWKLPLTLQGFFYGCVYESRNEDRDVLFRDSSDESGSEGNGEDGGGECKGDKSSGHFINLLGRSVSLVDPSFSVLRKQHRIKNFTLLDSCNGLLLFGHAQCSLWACTVTPPLNIGCTCQALASRRIHWDTVKTVMTMMGNHVY